MSQVQDFITISDWRKSDLGDIDERVWNDDNIKNKVIKSIASISRKRLLEKCEKAAKPIHLDLEWPHTNEKDAKFLAELIQKYNIKYLKLSLESLEESEINILSMVIPKLDHLSLDLEDFRPIYGVPTGQYKKNLKKLEELVSQSKLLTFNVNNPEYQKIFNKLLKEKIVEKAIVKVIKYIFKN